jgi:hypothetical protein
MDPDSALAYFVAYSPALGLAFGYGWRREDFPWLGIWEENHSRVQPPWNGRALTRGMEFGVSPMPETRHAMVERSQLFGAPCFRTLAAGSTIAVEYWAVVGQTDRIPESLDSFRALL